MPTLQNDLGGTRKGGRGHKLFRGRLNLPDGSTARIRRTHDNSHATSSTAAGDQGSLAKGAKPSYWLGVRIIRRDSAASWGCTQLIDSGLCTSFSNKSQETITTGSLCYYVTFNAVEPLKSGFSATQSKRSDKDLAFFRATSFS
jgi:hypothetical protein